MCSKTQTNKSIGGSWGRIEALKQALEQADALCIGAGAGLSASAGFDYARDRFERYFGDFARKYGFRDMYAGGFYPYETLEEYWAYWSRYIFVNRYQDPPKPVYDNLLKLAEGKAALLPGREKSWLLTCAANLCRSQLRSFWRRNVGELDESVPFKGESDRELWDAVMALPPKYRAVIHLYYWEGYDQGEIAEVLRVSRTAVQTRMARARDMLRKELSGNEQLLAHDGTGHAQ